jgi:hypothetical protein
VNALVRSLVSLLPPDDRRLSHHGDALFTRCTRPLPTLRAMVRIAAVCLALAALSLLGPSQPSYDPWAWLVWGRDLAHLSLDTTAGPSWKPLPVVFTTVFAPFSLLDERIPPALWMVVARAGGLLATVFAFKIAARLAGGSAARRWSAGIVAAGGLLLAPEWVRYLIHGNEAPLARVPVRTGGDAPDQGRSGLCRGSPSRSAA